jgi:hypothetical protein
MSLIWIPLLLMQLMIASEDQPIQLLEKEIEGCPDIWIIMRSFLTRNWQKKKNNNK